MTDQDAGLAQPTVQPGDSDVGRPWLTQEYVTHEAVLTQPVLADSYTIIAFNWCVGGSHQGKLNVPWSFRKQVLVTFIIRVYTQGVDV